MEIEEEQDKNGELIHFAISKVENQITERKELLENINNNKKNGKYFDDHDVIKIEEDNNAINWFFNDVFESSRFFEWMSTHYPEQYIQFKDLDSNEKKTALYLREYLWLTGEHLRHAPYFINKVFYEAYKEYEKGKYKKIEDFDRLNYYTDQLMKAYELWHDGKLNFDDIDDCGRNNIDLKVTFHEPEKELLWPLIIYYLGDIIQVKLWILSYMFISYKSGFVPSLDWFRLMIGQDVGALQALAIADASLLSGLFLLEWILRIGLNFGSIFTHLKSSLKINKFVIFRWILDIIPIALLLPYINDAYLFDNDNSIFGPQTRYINYLLVRLGLVMLNQGSWLLYTLLCRSTHDKIVLVRQILFLLSMGFISFIFEYFLIIPSMDDLYQRNLCGERSGLLQVPLLIKFFVELNSQKFICVVSYMFMWLSLMMSVAIDTGLSFILAVSLSVWMAGRKNKGSLRNRTFYHKDQILKDLQKRFTSEAHQKYLENAEFFWYGLVENWKNEGLINENNIDDNNVVNYKSLSSEIKERISSDFIDAFTTLKDEYAKLFWNDCVKEWKKQNLISEEDSTNIKEIQKNEKIMEDLFKTFPVYYTIKMNNFWDNCLNGWRKQDLISYEELNVLRNSVNIAELKSQNAQRQISYFLSSLELSPSKYYEPNQVPSLTTLIPVFNEPLMFSWDDKKTKKESKEEFKFLVGKHFPEWKNLCQRIKKKLEKNAKYDDDLSKLVRDTDDLDKLSNLLVREILDSNLTKLQGTYVLKEITYWLSKRDQYVFKTVEGACSYYQALDQLYQLNGEISTRDKIIKKTQVIAALQSYANEKIISEEDKKIIDKWLKKFPNLEIVYDIKDKLTGDYYTVQKKIKGKIELVENKIKRKHELVATNKSGERLQGKSMNQINGLTFARGQFIQVLDSNQGAHWTEYLKIHSMLYEFSSITDDFLNNYHPPKFRIIGAREYIFTKNLTFMGRVHAYQEWVFGTGIQRVYSALGIRLHYGHPDVFHGPWALYQAGLSKVNPNINVSEDVFAGFKALLEGQKSKHIESIQFEKGRETGITTMSIFDLKIGAGNASLMRSRDVYRLMEGFQFIPRILLFQGICGHFITTSLMTSSVLIYVLTLFLLTFGGASLRALGGLAFSSEWLFHAGLTTVVPLFVEFMVEHGLLGLMEALLFFPLSTLAYLFQLQTKHSAFVNSIWTGKSGYAASGRGLRIYREPLRDLFLTFFKTHFFPMFSILSVVFAYQIMSSFLGGGTLPLIMIYIFCCGVLLTPQVYNSTLTKSSVKELVSDMRAFIRWLGNPVDDVSSLKFIKNNFKNMSRNECGSMVEALLFIKVEELKTYYNSNYSYFLFAYSLLKVIFWALISTCLVYAEMQFWLSFFLFVWLAHSIIFWGVWALISSFNQAIRFVLGASFLVGSCVMMSIFYLPFGLLNFTYLYLAFLLFIICLSTLRSLFIQFALCIVKWKHNNDPKSVKERKMNEHLAYLIWVLDKLFLTVAFQQILALIWASVCFIFAVFARPQFWNLVLFGIYKPKELNLKDEGFYCKNHCVQKKEQNVDKIIQTGQVPQILL